MSVNGISGSNGTYGMTAYEQGKTYGKKEGESTLAKAQSNEGVVYEPSSDSDRMAVIAKLKADNQSRVDSFKSMVADMLVKQGFAVKNSDDIWKILAKGNFTVDAKTAQEAQQAISEDGYWGVNNTAGRMFEFAKAYAGDDEEKMKEMMNAFEKGFKQAENMWGGKLPEISYQTYDKMYELYNQYKGESAE
ncbi:MAG: hypothetical protein ACLRVQ_00180 [Lachnospiraceae bacterium]